MPINVKPQFVATSQAGPRTPAHQQMFCRLPWLKWKDAADARHRGTVALRAWRRAPSGPCYQRKPQPSKLPWVLRRTRGLSALPALRQSFHLVVSCFCNLGASVYPSMQLSTGAHLAGLQQVTLSIRTNRRRPSDVILCLLPLSCLHPKVNCWFCGCLGASAAPLPGQCLSGH